MEVVLKDSNFIEEKKQHPKSRYTSDIRRLRVGARPAHFIVSEARHIERGNINLYRSPPPNGAYPPIRSSPEKSQ